MLQLSVPAPKVSAYYATSRHRVEGVGPCVERTPRRTAALTERSVSVQLPVSHVRASQSIKQLPKASALPPEETVLQCERSALMPERPLQFFFASLFQQRLARWSV